jgi:hypothetical protein
MYKQYKSIEFVNEEIPSKITLDSNRNFLYNITIFVVPFITYQSKIKNLKKKR